QVKPHGVFFPKHTDDIQAAMELAHKFKVPVLPRTSGSSLAGQAVNEALIIDVTRHVDSILEINAEEKWVRVQPGVVLDHLNATLAPHGLKFGPDPASSNRAAMGGIVGNNSTGSHSILYGMTADHVLETAGMLSDGSPFHFKALSDDMLRQKAAGSDLESHIHKHVSELTGSEENRSIIAKNTAQYWRRCGGYNLDRLIESDLTYGYPRREKDFNLASLICGSEGTLGVMSEIKLGLVDLPQKSGLVLLMFNQLKSALAAVPTILEAAPSAIELIDHVSLRMCRQVPELARMLHSFADDSVYCILATEFYGESDSHIQHSTEILRKKLKGAGISCDFKPLKDPRLQQNVWGVRKNGLGLLM
ncbi:MAG: FAD-binding oxidoreductase, partial [Calditrichota bacterium]